MSRTSESTEPNAKRQEIEELYPVLTYHYGLSFEDLVHMPKWARRMYINALPKLIAETQLRAVEVVSFPHMKDGARRSMIRRLERKARRTRRTSAPPRKIEDMSEVGIKVIQVDAEGNPLEEAA